MHNSTHPPRRPLARLWDRLTPGRLLITYGPDPDAVRWGREGSKYSWLCHRCAGQDKGGGGFTQTLAAARARAKEHRRTRGHFGMRVVLKER